MTVIIIKTLFYVADTFNQFSLDKHTWGGGGVDAIHSRCLDCTIDTLENTKIRQ